MNEMTPKEAALLETSRLCAVVADLMRALVSEDEVYIRNNLARVEQQRNTILAAVLAWRGQV
jgi:hypothetical protein